MIVGMILIYLLGFLILGTIIAYFFGIGARLKEIPPNLFNKKSYQEGLEDGRKITLEEVEKIKHQHQIDYRSAARYLKKTCAYCGKNCIHCSRKK